MCLVILEKAGYSALLAVGEEGITFSFSLLLPQGPLCHISATYSGPRIETQPLHEERGPFKQRLLSLSSDS